jgi:hypothetical protein
MLETIFSTCGWFKGKSLSARCSPLRQFELYGFNYRPLIFGRQIDERRFDLGVVKQDFLKPGTGEVFIPIGLFDGRPENVNDPACEYLRVHFHHLDFFRFAARAFMICDLSAGLSRAQNALTAWLAAACFSSFVALSQRLRRARLRWVSRDTIRG